jgi:DNA invertase Pin-like site-specific DNA recombinase
MGALAKFERALISERSKAGMQATRKRGKHLGRPAKLNQKQINHAAGMVREGRETVSGMAGLFKVDRTTLHRALKRKNQQVVTVVPTWSDFIEFIEVLNLYSIWYFYS